MLTIYHVSGTRGVRPIWLCHELGVPVRVETIDFSPVFRATPEWRAISPTGKVPVLADGEIRIFESGAMVDHILERYGQGRLRPPPGSPQSALHHQWCWFSEATLIRPLGLPRLLKDPGEPAVALVADALEKTALGLEVVEAALARSHYLLGADFGAADIMMGFSLDLLAQLEVLDARYPSLLAYLRRLRAREGFIRARAA